MPRHDLRQGLGVSPSPAFGSYRVLRELARGGMGVVYEVEHCENGVRRALKTLLEPDEDELARFRREAEALGRLDHPHVVQVHEAVLSGPKPYLVQDLLGGGSLQERLERSGPLSPEEVRELGLKLTRGLRHAHAAGVLHRDLKPENVLFDDQGEPRLVDFGLALTLGERESRLTATGEVLGTPCFMAPEQAQGLETGPETDVYGLGAVLFAALTGQAPVPAGPLLQTLQRVANDPPPSVQSLRTDLAQTPALRSLEASLKTLLAKAPGQRPKLEELIETFGVAGGGERESRRGAWAALLALALALLAGGVALTQSAPPPPAPTASKEPEQAPSLEPYVRELSGYTRRPSKGNLGRVRAAAARLREGGAKEEALLAAHVATLSEGLPTWRQAIARSERHDVDETLRLLGLLQALQAGLSPEASAPLKPFFAKLLEGWCQQLSRKVVSPKAYDREESRVRRILACEVALADWVPG